MQSSEKEMNQEKIAREKYLKERKRAKKRIRNKRICICLILLSILIYIGYYLGEISYSYLFAKCDVILDAGHGGYDGGAVSGNAVEKDITLELCLKVKKVLEEVGYNVSLTREEDKYVGLRERAKYANKRRAKVFISIHCNASENNAEGIETYYYSQNSEELAQAVQNSMIEATGDADRGIKISPYTVITETNMPAVLAEVGFLNNDRERELMQTEEYQQKLAEGISRGIALFLKNKQ